MHVARPLQLTNIKPETKRNSKQKKNSLEVRGWVGAEEEEGNITINMRNNKIRDI